MTIRFKATRPARARLTRMAALLATASTAVLLSAPAYAQESASLRGTITAPADNAPVQVTAIDVNTGYRRTSEVASDGSYSFASLRPAYYRLEIALTNGTRSTDSFQLTVGQNAALDLDLTNTASVGTAEPVTPLPGAPADQAAADQGVATGNEIVVTANRIVSLQGGEVGTDISQRLIEQLPQNNRNFLAFADLAPGVQFIEGATSGQSRIQGGAQDSRTVNVFIDGVSQKDFVLKNGITGQDSSEGNPFPQLAVGEYRVISSNYQAEFDQVSSVAITAVTKSGTNEFHGEGFFDYTDQNLRQKFPTEIFNKQDKVQTKTMQFGGALGGPIVKDLMHFFVSYEGKRIQRPVEVFPGGGILPSALPQQYQDGFGLFNSEFNENLYFGKIDLVPTTSDLFEVTAKYRDETGRSGGGGIALQETQTLTEVDELRLLGRWQHTADNWINDLRVSYADVSWSPQPQNFEIGQVFRATVQGTSGTGATTFNQFDLLRIGGGTNFQDKGQKGTTVQNDFTYTGFDNHIFKVGFKTAWVKLNTLQQNFFNPLYTYDVNLFSQTGFNDQIPYRVQFGASSGPGNSVVESDNFQLGLYAQDEWQVTSRLTLFLGLRWDYERTPAFLDFVTPQENIDAVSAANYPNLQNANYDINDYISDGTQRKAFTGAFQPRLGFDWQFDDAGRFTLFGGYGRSYDRNQFDFLQQEISVGSFQVRTFNFQGNNSIPNANCNPSSTCIPFNPIYLTPEGREQLANSSPGGGRELRFINNDLKVPYADQFSLGLRSRFQGFNLEVGYNHVESKDGFAYLLGNRRQDGSFFFDNPNSTTDTPSSPFGFAPPGYGSILIGTNDLETTSDSGYVKFTKRYTLVSPWSLDATYTYTDATENRAFGETFSLDYPSIDDYPVLRSSGVPRHRLVMAGSVDVPIGVTLSGKFTYQSPVYLKGFFSTAVPFERNIVGIEAEPNGDRWGRRQFDFAVTKYIGLPFLYDGAKVRLRADVINAFNDRNYSSFNGNATDNTRTPNSPTVFGERVGYGVSSPPRTLKVSAGFSF